MFYMRTLLPRETESGIPCTQMCSRSDKLQEDTTVPLGPGKVLFKSQLEGTGHTLWSKLVQLSQQTGAPTCHRRLREAGLCVLSNQRHGRAGGWGNAQRITRHSRRSFNSEFCAVNHPGVSVSASVALRATPPPAVAGGTTPGGPGPESVDRSPLGAPSDLGALTVSGQGRQPDPREPSGHPGQ